MKNTKMKDDIKSHLKTILLICSSFASTSIFAEIKGISFSHGDWELACDNTGTCRAAGYHTDENSFENMVSVLLTRKAGTNTPVKAEFTMMVGDEKAVIPKQYILKINSQSYGKVSNQKENSTSLTPQQVQALLKSATQNSEIILDAGKNSLVLSGSGMSAVLLKMDEFQKRVGTSSALIKKGNRANENVLQPEAIPVVTVQPAIKGKMIEYKSPHLEVERIQNILKPTTTEEDCYILFNEQDADVRQVIVTPLTKDKSLVRSPCWSGAYNFGSGAWVMDHKLTKVYQMVSNSISDGDSVMLNASHKGRGLGDCWSSEEWVWNGQKFIQSYEAANLQCKGFPGGAWTMPTKISNIKESAR